MAGVGEETQFENVEPCEKALYLRTLSADSGPAARCLGASGTAELGGFRATRCSSEQIVELSLPAAALMSSYLAPITES